MQKTILVYVLTALVFSTAAIYFVAAAEESTESEDPEQEAAIRSDFDDDEGDQASVSAEESEGTNEEDENPLATQVETVFFAIVGVAYAAVGLWMLKDKGKTNIPYVIAIAGSISIIGLYIASRTMDLPIVGLQDDVGAIDIASKVLQVFIIGVAAYIVNYQHREVRARQHS